MNLSTEVKITQAITPTAGAAAATDLAGTTLDMSGWDGVLMIVTFGAITGGAVTSIKARQGAASNMSDAADLLGTGQVVADDDDGETRFIDLYKPTERYVDLYVDRATQNAVIACAHYIQYRGKKCPVSAHGTLVSGEVHASPAEGTA